MARPDAPETTEDVGLTIAPKVLLANDADPNGHTLQIERIDAGGRGAVALNPDGAITYTPAANFHGTDAFTYTVRNSEGATRRATALMRVRATNDAPVAGDDAATTEENHPVTLTAAALLGNDEDVDGDALRVLAVGDAQRGLTRVNPDGSVTYTPGLDFAGIDQFTYRVSDGHGGNATGTVSITVTPADDPPVMTADAVEATAVVAGAAALAMVVAGPMAAAVAMVAAGATATAAATAAVVAGATTAGVPANRETGGHGGPAAGANVEDPIVAAAPPEEIADDTRVEQLRQAMAAFAPSESATDMTLSSDLQHQLTPVLAAALPSGQGHS